MHVVATFDHSNFLELAITDLKQNGIEKDSICAIPVKKITPEIQLLDSIHGADGQSMFDVASILGTIFMLFGVLWGFLWKWGPIIWGLIGLGLGFAVGFAIKYFIYFRKTKTAITKGRQAEVVLIIKCEKEEILIIEKVLKRHFALAIGTKQ
ncbi:hypothetical protein H1S01_17585 [Heliobacterium chlorum]|uniref:Uncharacterized protein n=1 Tax=Heliobacterium chlorum TaxID=2698 RepID=A0ABR7T673_HELCL|nr:hypothetical protein [Heliobacterium chlorum]MBC9786273.1 hypothetical protein [Heliobacterium chlorum]